MLQIVLPSAEYYVQALSDAEAQEWLEALEVNARSHTYIPASRTCIHVGYLYVHSTRQCSICSNGAV